MRSRWGIAELEKMGVAKHEDLMDSVVIRVPKAYPGYYDSYKDFDTIRSYTDTIDNLFLIGRNGMHRYNNQDYSKLTAFFAVEAIINGTKDKPAIWDVYIDDNYNYNEQGVDEKLAMVVEDRRKAA